MIDHSWIERRRIKKTFERQCKEMNYYPDNVDELVDVVLKMKENLRRIRRSSA